MKYFQMFCWGRNPANNLQRGVLDYMQKNDRKIIDAFSVDNYKHNLSEAVEELKVKHPKCTTIPYIHKNINIEQKKVTVFFGELCSVQFIEIDESV